jgi:cysteine desulfuration protein SufE
MAQPAPPQGRIDKTVLIDYPAYRHPGLSVICRGLRGRGAAEPLAIMTIDEITENFALLDDWDDRYRYVIELGRTLEPLPEAARTEANKVLGCASQVWLWTDVDRNGQGTPILRFTGDSDAHIVRGLIAILFAVYSGKPAQHILDVDALALFDRLGLREHLTPQRSNGLKSMVGRIRDEARKALVFAGA